MTASDVVDRQQELLKLRNMGPTTLRDLRRLGIGSVEDLRARKADDLYLTLCKLKGTRQDPSVHDVFSAIIHEARTGEPRNWWAYTRDRKVRMSLGDFPRYRGG